MKVAVHPGHHGLPAPHQDRRTRHRRPGAGHQAAAPWMLSLAAQPPKAVRSTSNHGPFGISEKGSDRTGPPGGLRNRRGPLSSAVGALLNLLCSFMQNICTKLHASLGKSPYLRAPGRALGQVVRDLSHGCDGRASIRVRRSVPLTLYLGQAARAVEKRV
jgi:hypothetical protein